MSLRQRLGPLRVPFLPLTAVCVGLGIALASRSGIPVESTAAVLAMIGALAAHVSVNAFNEYFDFKSGLDALTQRTPFSGGSGVLPAHPDLARYVLSVAIGALVLTIGVGLYFVWLRGVTLLWLGLVGIALVLAYTTWITKRPWLCLLAPGLGFGPLMVVGTFVALTGTLAPMAWAASAPVFFLVNNLLLLNQFPDIEPDAKVGRKTLPIAIGPTRSAYVFAALAFLAYASLVACVWRSWLPRSALLGMLTLTTSLPAAAGVLMNAEKPSRLTTAMTLNTVTALVTPALLAGAIGFG